jgi:ankyrin repeat protein
MLSLLLLKGANIKFVDRKEKTALHFAAFMSERCAC